MSETWATIISLAICGVIGGAILLVMSKAWNTVYRWCEKKDEEKH